MIEDGDQAEDHQEEHDDPVPDPLTEVGLPPNGLRFPPFSRPGILQQNVFDVRISRPPHAHECRWETTFVFIIRSMFSFS